MECRNVQYSFTDQFLALEINWKQEYFTQKVRKPGIKSYLFHLETVLPQSKYLILWPQFHYLENGNTTL